MILIDDRQGSKELQAHINAGVNSDLTRLEYGDVAFDGCGPDDTPVLIGVERKAISDLASSIATGRLSGHQLIGLLRCYQYVYIIIDGLWRSNNHSGILEVYRGKGWQPLMFGQRQFMAREITGYINTLTMICNVVVWRVDGIAQAGRWISDLYAWWQKPWDKHKAHLQFHNQPVPRKVRKEINLLPPSKVRLVAKEFSSIGWAKSKAIAERFQTVREFVNATREDFMEIPGIGKILADKIIRELEE